MHLIHDGVDLGHLLAVDRISRDLPRDRTQLLTAVVKPHYAPIEQYAETPGMRQGPWTDIYALAAVDPHCADYVAAHALSDDEGANAEAVATALRTVPSSADCGDGFVAFGAVS